MRASLVAITLALVGPVGACRSAAPPGGSPTTTRAGATPGPATLAFAIDEGATQNLFYRRGEIAAHVVASSSPGHQRLVFAFPAGNSGAGVWFDDPRAGEGGVPTGGFAIRVRERLEPVERPGGARGVRVVVNVAGPHPIRVAKAILGSVISIREWVPPGLTFPPLVNQVSPGPPARITRTMIDGRHHIDVRFIPLGGTRIREQGGHLVLAPAPDTRSSLFQFAVEVTTDERPLSPIPLSELLRRPSRADPDLVRALAFLSYREKLLAGSWRFLNYFGRDTLLSVQMLMPAVKPAVTEAGLRAVIERLAPDGNVAHYEEIGDFASLRNVSTTPRPADVRQPYYEYRMVDDDFLLAPVLATYLETPDGARRAAAFLAEKTPSGETYAAAVRRNIEFVLQRAAPFAAAPTWQHLISLRPDYPWGEWRDSSDGLGRGLTPFDVNVGLVPAALRASAALLRRPELGADPAGAARAEQMAAVWDGAERFFRVDIGANLASQEVADYARHLGLARPDQVTAPVVFDALSLDRSGKPVAVENTDDGFVLLFDRPPPTWLERAAAHITARFPAGLSTPVGVVVANPAFAGPDLWDHFTTGDYHGTVVWSWQQAMLAAGLARQLERRDLPAGTAHALRAAQTALWRGIESTRRRRAGELWSFAIRGSRISWLPFAVASHTRDESNAVQLWSTVYLALDDPLRPR